MSVIAEKNRARYWVDRQAPGLSLLRADFTTHEYPAHIHEALMVAVTETGDQRSAPGVYRTKPIRRRCWW